MLKKLFFILVILTSILSAETFRKGDLVLVKSGYPVCFNSKEDKDSIKKVTEGLNSFIISMLQIVKNNRFQPMLRKGTARVCMIFDKPYEAYFLGEGKDYYYIYDKEDYGAVVKGALVKVENSNQANQQKNEGPKYSFVGIDDLESFPSDYLGKKVYLICKKTQVEEDRNGGYSIMGSCLKSDKSLDFLNNPFRIKLHTNSREIAKTIAKSKNRKKYLLGTVIKNPSSFGLAKYVFEIEDVQF